MRYRYIGLIGGSAAVLAALFWTDPDSNVLTTRMMMLALVSPIIAIALAHVYRKVLHDYPEAQTQRRLNSAKRLTELMPGDVPVKPLTPQ